MKAVCAFCGFGNAPAAATCAQCGAGLENARREKFRLPWVSWVPAIPIAALLLIHHARSENLRADQEKEFATRQEAISAEYAAELKKLEAQLGRAEAEEEAKHRAWLNDPRITSGRVAAERHATEWARRQAHDPEFARSLLEKTLVEVEKLGKDPALTGEAALRKVAEMIAPPGSRIEVTPGNGRFVVRVAFRLSALSPSETGGATVLGSAGDLHKAVEEATARLIKDIFDYCGSRGIERLSVSCNRAIGNGDEANPRLQMRSLYRATVDAATAAQVSNWRSLPLAQVSKLMKVERDLTSQLMIRRNVAQPAPLDPNEPLEF